MNESVQMRIDFPDDQVIRTPISQVRGWFGSVDRAAAEGLQFRIGDAQVAWQVIARPDVTGTYADMCVVGFSMKLDLSHYLYAIQDNELTVRIVPKNGPAIDVRFTLARGVMANCLAAAAGA